MTNTIIREVSHKTKDHFKQVYQFTLKKLYHPNHVSADAPLHLLRLLAEDERHITIYALELWLFCEARKLQLTNPNISAKSVEHRIARRFLALLQPEQHTEVAPQMEAYIKHIMTNMGFKPNKRRNI